MVRTLVEVGAAFPWFFPSVAFVFGACVGSFLNVVIHRVPAGQSVVRPGSHCACGAPIAWYDNIPLFSWFVLRGRARCCGRRFSARYPAVEFLTGVLFLACWLRFPPPAAAAAAVFLSCLVAATFIDLEHMVIPDVFTIGLGLTGIFLSFLVPSLHGRQGDVALIDSFRSGVDAIVGLVAGSGIVLWIALVAEAALRKEAMGFGDVKFVGAIGAFCGWHGAVFSIFGGAAVGTVWFSIALAWQKLSGNRAPGTPRARTAEGEDADLGLGMHVPFGPMLAIAGALYLLIFHRWVDPWFAELAVLF